MARYQVLGLVAGLALAVTGCTKGGGSGLNGPTLTDPMTIGEANNFVDSLTKSLGTAAGGCQNRLPVRFGTSPVNLSCQTTRTCTGGGTIRPSFTATGQITVGELGGHWSSPMSGSQNILNWACATGSDRVISGNPTVSISGQWNGSWSSSGAVDVAVQIRQSGQIIVGSRSCSMNLLTTGDTSDIARTSGSICGLTIDRATNMRS